MFAERQLRDTAKFNLNEQAEHVLFECIWVCVGVHVWNAVAVACMRLSEYTLLPVLNVNAYVSLFSISLLK